MSETQKPHHLSAEGRALRAKEEADRLAAEQSGNQQSQNLENEEKDFTEFQEKNLSEIQVNNEEIVAQEKEPSIPLSQVSNLVAQEVAKALANLQPQQPDKVKEVVKEVYTPLVAKDENFDEIPGLEDFEVKEIKITTDG